MRNIAHKFTGDDLTADEFNDIPEEEENLITSSGQTLTAGDLYQIAKAVSTYAAVGDFYGDAGSGNNYILTAVSPLQAPIQYLDGFRVRFRISHTNTGAATVNVNSLGVKAIVKADGISSLGPGDLPQGEHGELIFHTDIDSFELYSHKYEDQSFGTGDNIWTDRTGERAGWIWINDSSKTTIGDATSGATIRANADCEQLFKLFWTAYADTECPVVGGRGGTADDDWAAHKRITVPWGYARVFASHDINDPDAIRIGQLEGEKKHALSAAENGEHSHGISDPGHHHPTPYLNYRNKNENDTQGWAGDGTTNTSTSGVGISLYNSGSGTPHSIMQPTISKNLYIKL